MDINGLKRFNDAKGHVYGDMIVTHVSDMIKKFFPDARIFRLSGDEFLVVSESLTYEAFMTQVSSLEESLSENYLCIISMGTTWNDIYTDLNESLNKADRLMYMTISRVILWENRRLRKNLHFNISMWHLHAGWQYTAPRCRIFNTLSTYFLLSHFIAQGHVLQILFSQ